MKNIVLLLILVVLTFGCELNGKKETGQNDGNSFFEGDNHPNKKIEWFDSLIVSYINKSDNEFIELSRKDTAIKFEWFLDRVEKIDGAKYLIFHIGHDVVDEGDINMRFVTDSWIYIDSLTRNLYEYDLPNDTIIEWNK